MGILAGFELHCSPARAGQRCVRAPRAWLPARGGSDGPSPDLKHSEQGRAWGPTAIGLPYPEGSPPSSPSCLRVPFFDNVLPPSRSKLSVRRLAGGSPSHGSKKYAVRGLTRSEDQVFAAGLSAVGAQRLGQAMSLGALMACEGRPTCSSATR